MKAWHSDPHTFARNLAHCVVIAAAAFALHPALAQEWRPQKNVEFVVFNSGNLGATAMLGGHVDMLVGTPGTVLPHLVSGKVRVVGISAPERQKGALAVVPTFREQGIDAVYYSWRGFVGAAGLTPAQTAFWDQAFAKVIQAEEWKQDLERNAWAEDFRGSAETRKHLDAEYELLKKMLVDLGVVTR